MSYVQSAVRGNVLGTLQHAILTGTLWAIGISWSTAIRSITLALVPSDTRDQILGELLSTGIVTVLGVSTAILIGWCGRRTAAPAPAVEPTPRWTNRRV